MKIYIHVTESVNLAHTLCWRDICCVTALLFVRPSVCMSVCLSQAGIVSKRLEGSSWFLACRLPSICPTLFCEEVRIPTKKRVLPSGTFSKLRTMKISPRQVDRVVNKTRRRSNLLTTPIRLSTSRGCLLHVGHQ